MKIGGYYERGAALAAQGRHAEAICDLSKASLWLPSNKRSDLFYQERGIAHQNLGQMSGSASIKKWHFARAFEDYSMAIAINPSYGWAYHRHGIMHLRFEEPEKALADYNTAAALLPEVDRYWVLQDRAAVKQQLGDLQGAAADRQRAQMLTAKR